MMTDRLAAITSERADRGEVCQKVPDPGIRAGIVPWFPTLLPRQRIDDIIGAHGPSRCIPGPEPRRPEQNCKVQAACGLIQFCGLRHNISWALHILSILHSRIAVSPTAKTTFGNLAKVVIWSRSPPLARRLTWHRLVCRTCSPVPSTAASGTRRLAHPSPRRPLEHRVEYLASQRGPK